MIRGGHRPQGWEWILRGIGMSCRSRDGRSVAGRVAVAATECRGGLLPLGRASLAATALPFEASNTEIWQSLLDDHWGARSARGGSPRPTEGAPLRCLCRVAGGASGGGRGHDETIRACKRALSRSRLRLSQTFDWSSRLRVVVVSAPPLATEGAPPTSPCSRPPTSHTVVENGALRWESLMPRRDQIVPYCGTNVRSSTCRLGVRRVLCSVYSRREGVARCDGPSLRGF